MSVQKEVAEVFQALELLGAIIIGLAATVAIMALIGLSLFVASMGAG